MSLERVIASQTVPVSQEYKYKLNAALREAVNNYKRRILAWVDQNKKIPIATGYLKQSASEIIGLSAVSGTTFSVYFGFGADYAKYVDEGRTAGKLPPVGAIEAWCITKGIPIEAAWAIAEKLKQEGYEGKHFFESGITHAKQVFSEEIQRALLKYGLKGVLFRP